MNLTIKDVLGVAHAEIEITPGQAIEVTGPNAAGKTSIAIALAAVASHTHNPIGVPAPEGKRVYTREGTEGGRVVLVDGANAHEWATSSATIGAPPNVGPLSRPEAVGLVDFTARRGAKERALLFQDSLLPPPDAIREAVAETLREYLEPSDLAGVLKMLGERGWDATENVYAERARVKKREWSGITGATYGVRVAADWRPDGWLADHDSATVQQSEEGVQTAREQLAALQLVQAISQAEFDAAEEAAARIPDLERAQREASEALRRSAGDLEAIPIERARDRVEQALGDLRAARGHDAAACPHCGGPISIVGGRLVAAETVDTEPLEEALGKARSHVGDLNERIEALRPDHLAAATVAREASAALDAARSRAAASGQVETEDDRQAVAEAEQAVADALEVVRLVKAEADAARLQQTIIRYTEIAKAIGPQGVRAKMLADGLARLNAGLAAIEQTAGWPAVHVGERGDVLIGGRPAPLASESERWRAQAALQLTLAALTGSRIVVIDRADVLDGSGVTGLEAAVGRVAGKTGIAVVVCATHGAHGRERTKWPHVEIEGGTIK